MAQGTSSQNTSYFGRMSHDGLVARFEMSDAR